MVKGMELERDQTENDRERETDRARQTGRETAEKEVRPEISGQHKALILRRVESNQMVPCGHLQSHSRPHPGKGGPAVGR